MMRKHCSFVDEKAQVSSVLHAVSNPDPTFEEIDVSGAIHLWKHLNNQDGDRVASFKVWKVSEARSIDVAGIEEPYNDYAKVFGAGIVEGEVPTLKITGLRWKMAEAGRSDLFAEAHDRIMERSELDRFQDAILLSVAMTLFTTVYAVFLHHEGINGKYPSSMMPHYIFDKAIAWTALWMMVVPSFAGNLLVIKSVWERVEKAIVVDKAVLICATVLMAFPFLEFLLTWGTWYILRNLFFRFCLGRKQSLLYLSQSATTEAQDATQNKDCTNGEYSVLYHSIDKRRTSAPMMAMMIDMVSLKHEIGCVGFIFVLIHSFSAFIFVDGAGEHNWNIEVMRISGCTSTAFLFCVFLRSLFGKASWIRLKPIYSYLAPVGVWLAVIHTFMYGYANWHKQLFHYEYNKGQPAISFLSTFFTAAVLVVNLSMALLGTKRRVAENQHIWKHSSANFARYQWAKLQEGLNQDGSSLTAAGGQSSEDSSSHARTATKKREKDTVPSLEFDC